MTALDPHSQLVDDNAHKTLCNECQRTMNLATTLHAKNTYSIGPSPVNRRPILCYKEASYEMVIIRELGSSSGSRECGQICPEPSPLLQVST